jgi:acetate kinase
VSVKAAAKDGQSHRVKFECECANQRGEAVIQGDAEVIAPTEKVKRLRAILPEVRLHDRGARYRQLIDMTKGLAPIRTAVVHPVDRYALMGALDAAQANLIVPILIDPEAKIRATAEAADVDLAPYRLIPTAHSHEAHGGEQFAAPVLVDDAILDQLEKLAPLAPLHQPHNLAPIRVIGRIAPDVAQVACFDTAFHRTQPPVSQIYALPRDLSATGVKRYGFHGLSYDYIASVLPGLVGDAARGRVAAAHLGNGCSMCAMRNGKSVATTTGFTALEGLPMGTRSGAIDPGVILYLLTERGMSVADVSDLLYHRSGLLGMSGISNDMRTLLASNAREAADAVDLFVYRITRELGSLAAALGGLDVLVFTAGIGEHAAPVRARVCESAAWLGIRLDAAANLAGGPRISTADSPVSVWVVPTNEELMIARHTLARTRL